MRYSCLRYSFAIFSMGVAALIVAGPVLTIAIEALAEGSVGWAELGLLIIPGGRRLTLLLNTMTLALVSAGTGMILSWFIGCFMWQQTRRQPRFAAYAAVFIWFMALLPPFIHSYTWITVFDAANNILNVFGLEGMLFTGLPAGWWTQTMAWLPLCLSAALFGFRGIDPDLTDAAQLVASPLRVLVRVITPLVSPAILVGGALVFLMCLQEYSIPSLFQVSTYSLEIFSDYSAYNQPIRALLLSAPLVVISGAVLWGTKPCFRHVSTMAPRGGRKRNLNFPLPLWFRILQYSCLMLLLAQILLPLLTLVRTVGSWGKLIDSVAASSPEILFSFQTATVSAVIALIGSVVVNEILAVEWQNFVFPLTAVSLCLPGTLTGIGMIALYNGYFFGFLYNSELMPVVAAISRFGPLAWLIGLAQQRRQDYSLLEAASLFPVGSLKLWTCIRLPLMMPGMIVAGMTVFLLAMGELSATLLVLPPGSNTLAVRTYNLLHYGASESVAGLCLFLVLTGWLSGLIAITVLAKRRA